jgi:hypothetical protein
LSFSLVENMFISLTFLKDTFAKRYIENLGLTILLFHPFKNVVTTGLGGTHL